MVYEHFAHLIRALFWMYLSIHVRVTSRFCTHASIIVSIFINSNDYFAPGCIFRTSVIRQLKVSRLLFVLYFVILSCLPLLLFVCNNLKIKIENCFKKVLCVSLCSTNFTTCVYMLVVHWMLSVQFTQQKVSKANYLKCIRNTWKEVKNCV